MLSRPTTDQVIRGVMADLTAVVLPCVADGPARVALGMIDQLLRGCAERAAHEVAWMHDEVEAIAAEARQFADDAAVAEALRALAAAPTGLDLDHVVERYHRAGEVLAACVDAAFARADEEGRRRLVALLRDRNRRELQITGTLDLVGRG